MFLFSGTQPVKQNKISKLLARNGLGWGWKDGLKSAWFNSRSPWAQFPELMWKKNNLGAVAGHCKTRAGELNIGGSLDLPSQPMYQMCSLHDTKRDPALKHREFLRHDTSSCFMANILHTCTWRHINIVMHTCALEHSQTH